VPGTLVRRLRVLFVFASSVISAVLQPGDPFPPLLATSTAGTKVALPEAQAGHAFVAVFGFSRDSAQRSQIWGERIAGEYGSRFALYAVPVLDTVPAPFRSFALTFVRSATPADNREHVVPLFDGEWRARLCPPDPDDPAVVVIGADGRVAALYRGAFNDAAFAELRPVLDRLTPR
jgi:hypothetical protein